MESSVLPLMATLLGLVVSTLLTILLFQMRGQRKDTRAVGEKLDHHILEMTKTLALKVDFEICRGTRGDCMGLVNKIIREPLEAQIREIHSKRKDRWTQQAEENRQLWSAVKHHSHTGIGDPNEDRVVIKGDE